MLAALPLVAATLPAAAMSSQYECADGGVLQVSYTPKLAQVQFGDRHWTLQRARAAGAAQYVNAREKVTLVSQRSEVVLTTPAGEQRCRLQRGGGEQSLR